MTSRDRRESSFASDFCGATPCTVVSAGHHRAITNHDLRPRSSQHQVGVWIHVIDVNCEAFDPLKSRSYGIPCSVASMPYLRLYSAHLQTWFHSQCTETPLLIASRKARFFLTGLVGIILNIFQCSMGACKADTASWSEKLSPGVGRR